MPDKHKINPFMEYPCSSFYPFLKFVVKKNIHAPNKAPEILLNIAI